MRRIPLLLVVIAGTLSLLAGSAVAAAVRTAASPPVNSSLPTIAGTAQQGHTLTASNGSWSGTTPISFTYQWQRCNSSGSSCGAIGNAKNQNYVASSGDVGRTIRVEVTATNADGTSQSLSGPTAVIAGLGNVPANTKQPDPSGTAQDGRTITVNHGSWSGSQPITFTYQWQSCTAVNSVCTNLAGRTGSSFLLGSSQVGMVMRATILATNTRGPDLGVLERDGRRPRQGERAGERHPPGDLRLDARRSADQRLDGHLDESQLEHVHLPVESL